MDIKKIIKESCAELMTESYEGYVNFPTFFVAHHLNNDKTQYDFWQKTAKEMIKQSYQGTPNSNAEDTRQAAISELGELIKNNYENDVPTLDPAYQDLLDYSLGSVDWNEVAGEFINSDTAKSALDSVFPTTSLNEGVLSEMDLDQVSQVSDAEYLMAQVKGSGKEDQYAIIAMPRDIKIYFQDPIKLVNAITNERGNYKFVKYIKDHKDPNITPKPHFMQVFKAFKVETHELNPQHESDQKV